MHPASSNLTARWRTRRQLSAVIWLLFPALSQFAFRGSALGAYFNTLPSNSSYDAMFVAAAAGLGLTSLWFLRFPPEPIAQSWRNALDLFELTLAALLTGTALAVGVPATAAVWFAAFLALLISTLALAQTQSARPPAPSALHTALSRAASATLLFFAILFVKGPVIHPIWSGPQEPFVRWHPFSPPAELIWRGIFLSFALGMGIAAFDPLRRHRLFLVALAMSGGMHASEMAADNLQSAHHHACNGNPQHLYGDVLGWYVVAFFAAIMLVLSRRQDQSPAKN